MYKKVIPIMLISLFIVGTGVSLSYLLKHNFGRSFHHKHTENTNLSNENMNGFYLFENINDEKFLDIYGKQIRKSADHDIYNYYLIDNGIEIATNSKGEILRFLVESKKEPTSKGIRVGDSLEKAKSAYGDNFYERLEQGVYILGYIDKKNHQSIEFWHYDNKIFFYRFDDNSMD